MNERVRRELRALRIDPDIAFQMEAGIGVARRPGRWFTRRTWLLVLGVSGLVCIFVVGSLVLALRFVGGQGQASRPQERIVTHMSFAGLEADIAEPQYRSLATDGTTPSVQWITLQMDVANGSETTVAVEAGDLILVDAHGALFPPSWREPGGATRDGFSAPDHTLFGLAPGGTTEVALVFIIRDGGQYWLRYTGPGTEAGGDVPLPIR